MAIRIQGAAGSGATHELVVSRLFQAPRERVWMAHVEADRIKRWWAPPGCGLEIRRFDFHPGGLFHYSMLVPEESRVWCRLLYCDIASPACLAALSSFSNEGGGIARAPFCDSFPLEVLSTVALASRNGDTLLTLALAPHGASEAEDAAFDRYRDSLERGYSASFDRLAAYLDDAGAHRTDRAS